MARFLLVLFLVLSVALTVVVEVKAQKRCKVILNPSGCDLSACRQQCLNSYNGNGVCTSGGSVGTYICTCVYNC
ncbi:hypothetical protein C2S53_000117 [Perilla frutescens var. hirtella]|uniref:Defensin n=1 Tax=Perilla frutescens var. hirtella TaxID=608512 RepID=A0AAD4P2S3_PERFH|nr:hypothetical protein C2S53_000117 [Perilla frutescens var. hirtella]